MNVALKSRVEMMAAVPTESNWGELGPAMKALPSDRWRAFVEFYLIETCTNKNKNFKGAKEAAARKARFGKPNSSATTLSQIGYRILQDPRMIAAIAEEGRKFLRSSIAPEAIKALENMVRDPEHKDHARAVAMVLDRTDPLVAHQQIDVTHKHVDADQEGIEELRALRQLGTSHEKLVELFGGNGLARLEALEAADTAQRAQHAKVIEGEAVEIESEDTNG
jgi:hypothetical protein